MPDNKGSSRRKSESYTLNVRSEMRGCRKENLADIPSMILKCISLILCLGVGPLRRKRGSLFGLGHRGWDCQSVVLGVLNSATLLIFALFLFKSILPNCPFMHKDMKKATVQPSHLYSNNAGDSINNACRQA